MDRHFYLLNGESVMAKSAKRKPPAAALDVSATPSARVRWRLWPEPLGLDGSQLHGTHQTAHAAHSATHPTRAANSLFDAPSAVTPAVFREDRANLRSQASIGLPAVAD